MTNDVILPMKTQQLILEGPDLVGKTTLYSAIHKQTNYKWNIQDRSTLSMLCYARQFGRDTAVERERLENELNNLNNRMVILLPDFSVIEERYHQRGDEIQDIQSLKVLYDIFVEESSKIRSRPNVMCLTSNVDTDNILMSVEEWSHSLESCDLSGLGDVVRDTLHAIEHDEASLTARVCYDLGEYDNSILNNQLEGEYYKKILNSVSLVIKNEISGLNPYGVPQERNSRRFYYNSDTCISSIHFLPRESVLNTHVVFRSLDVDKNACIDLSFIDYLTHEINKRFEFDCNRANVRVTFNNAHIRRDLQEA